MQTQFYISQNEKTMGPWSLEEICSKIETKEISATDYIFVDSSQDWQCILEFKELSEKLNIVKPKPKAKPLASEASSDLQLKDQKPESDEWYVLKGEKKFGPFEYLEMLKMLQSKNIFEFDFVWKKSMASWQRIAELEDFRADKITNLSKNEKLVSEEVFYRRRHARTNLESTVIVHDNQKLWKAESIQISEGGCGLKIWNSMLLPGQQVYIHFKPDSHILAFNAVAEIVSKKFEENIKSQSAPIVYGLKFLSLGEEAKLAVRQLASKKTA